MRLAAIAFAMILGLGRAFGADVATPVKPLPRAIAYPCTVTSCSGFYVGANLTGVGADVTDFNTGVPANAFTSGGGLGGQLGYQFWNGQFFFAGEVFGDYTALNLGTGNGFRNTWVFGEVGKFGMGLSGLLGQAQTAPTAPSQAPVALNVPATLSQGLLSPYVAVGAVERPWGTGWAVGGGISYIISQNWNLDVMYLNINYNNANVNSVVTEQRENMIKLGLNYHM